ncbi:MFS transporter [Methylorubrum extorquens]|uniref:MFS transporter n=1 Tax=Methylorubrum extorquens TaxID=408 RepID=UPI00223842CD|nr:MFS transporter [Methylorubrum extorquens]UYW24674.1 MFS transporter [Methylorubrum extorquens]UYW30504.1 MFS transporter [Methylorubrum extorquens]
MASLPILALAVASFGIGTTEFVIMGLLPEMARDFDVTIPQAGHLVSGYALGVVIGAPLVATATAHLPRKAALLALMAVFTLGNLACALAPSYAWLMAARVATAFAHGAFFGIGAIVARNLVPREKRTQAVSLMFAGLTLANVLGVPLGTALGQAFGWRSTFWAVVGIGLVAGAAIALALPGGMPGTRGGLGREFRALGRWPVLRPMLVSTLSSVSFFTVFTYIAPFLLTVTHLTPGGVTGALFAAGVGLTIGNLAGGWLADRSLMRTVLGSFAALIAVLVVFPLVAPFTWPALAVLVLWSGLAFALVSPLQVWVLEAASDAPNLASTLNQGAFNLGNALGAWLGGTALTLGVGYAELPALAAVVSLLGLGLAATGAARSLSPSLAASQGRS